LTVVRVLRFGIIVLALALAAPITSDAAKPQRIASLNVCTDQLVIALAERSRIATVTFLAPNPDTSFYYREAKGLPINRGAAEEVLALKPDLIVAGTYTTPATTALLKKLGHRVELFDPDDSLKRMRKNIRRMALLLGESEKAEQLISNMDRRLAAVVQAGMKQQPVAVIFRANGFTMGKHSLINDILTLAGFRHLSAEMAMDQAGFLPLEKMIAADPALIIFGQYKPNHPSIAHQLLEHPALKSLLASRAGGKSRDSIIIPSNLWNCGGPFIAEAVEMLARKHKTLSRAGVSP
jgi:iron complex transport system substrate-binding protein